MLKVFGRNNNRLFRNSKKQTYSMPQSLQFEHQVRKGACGHDFIAVVTTSNSLYFLYQAQFHSIENLKEVLDIATSDSTIAVVTLSGEVLVWDFDYEKVQHGIVNYTTVKLNLDDGDIIKRVEMGSNDIFLLSEDGKVYHFRRNQWYETKTYSNIESIELSKKIVEISSGLNLNLFLTYQGELLSSCKKNPLYLEEVKTKHKFIKISASSYAAGITKKGVIMIWGQSIHGNYSEPTQFYKLTKKFIDISLDQHNGFAIADDGEIWGWGVNANGELGLSDYETRTKPFPIITLEEYTGIQIMCGESYTCCLCYPNEKDGLKVLERKKQTFRCEQNLKITPKNNNKKVVVFQEKSLIKKRSNSPSLENMKQNRQVSKGKKTQNKRQVSGNKPLTPKNKVNTKKQLSPYVCPKSHKKTPSKSSIKQQNNAKDCENKNLKAFSVKLERQPQFYWDKEQIVTEQEQKWNKQAEQEISQLKFQNKALKEKVQSQGEIIQDITQKIRLLEEAIDEYEKTLTNRDHIVQEFQLKQQKYISHINELQQKVDEIVHNLNKNNEVTVIYDSMKEDFDRERGYYLQKLEKFQEMLNQERECYQIEINSLKEQVKKKQRGVLTSKENAQPSWDSQSPINGKNDYPHFKKIENSFNPQQLPESEMEQMIQKIQTNKSRINKSANKLIAMLDMSS